MTDETENQNPKEQPKKELEDYNTRIIAQRGEPVEMAPPLNEDHAYAHKPGHVVREPGEWKKNLTPPAGRSPRP